ncbi:MAG TPA: LysR family transcriptional regulator [Phycisphaerales bacterium]|nr:LysR family transcriptional regulator [Phycisphaerales bacterium]
MDLQRLRYFLAVAEAGSVSRAAARLRVTQPSVSQQLGKLEASVGRRLFDRQGRGMVLTDAGRGMHTRAARIIAEVDSLLRDGAGMEEGSTRLAVGAIPTMAPYILPRALSALRKKLPECEISVREDVTERLVEMLHDNVLDCAILSTPIDDPMIELEVVGREELLAVVPAAWPEARGPMLTVADLREHPAILLEDVHCLSQQVKAFCTARKVAPRVVCRMTQLSTVLELVGLGMGLSIVPEMAARVDTSNVRKYVRLTSMKPVREIALAWRRGRTRGRGVEGLGEILKRHWMEKRAS